MCWTQSAGQAIVLQDICQQSLREKPHLRGNYKSIPIGNNIKKNRRWCQQGSRGDAPLDPLQSGTLRLGIREVSRRKMRLKTPSVSSPRQELLINTAQSTDACEEGWMSRSQISSQSDVSNGKTVNPAVQSAFGSKLRVRFSAKIYFLLSFFCFFIPILAVQTFFMRLIIKPISSFIQTGCSAAFHWHSDHTGCKSTGEESDCPSASPPVSLHALITVFPHIANKLTLCWCGEIIFPGKGSTLGSNWIQNFTLTLKRGLWHMRWNMSFLHWAAEHPAGD